MDLAQLLPAFIRIAAGPFLMGTPERELSALAKAYGGTRESYREESPQFSLSLPAFAIAQTPVTNALYVAYVATTGVRPPISWRGSTPPTHLLDHPAVDVSWEEASAFCGWLNEARDWRLGSGDSGIQFLIAKFQASVFRLPTEAEWERAARGADGRAFPWGATWDNAKANTREGGRGGTSPVGAYSAGASSVGALDMAGNVWEWTSTLDQLYPYDPRDGREDPSAPGRRILRGGCYANPHGYARCACRFRLPTNVRNEFLGFRLAYSVQDEGR
jgi:toxoflavin biosynthesis protein ToxD